MQIPGGKYRNCFGNTDFYFGYFCDDEGFRNVSQTEESEKGAGRRKMLITLGLILLILIMVVGGDRGVVSLIALCGNLLILSLAIWLMASGVPVLLVTVCVGVVISCITLFYQNGRNGKTWSAFLATMITMLLLFFFIYLATL